MSETLWDHALNAYHDGLVADVNREDDNCGYASLVRFDLHDGSYIIAGAEEDGGYTWSMYDSEDEFVGTDGGTDLADFPDELAKLAKDPSSVGITYVGPCHPEGGIRS